MGFFRKMFGQETAGNDASAMQAPPPAPETTRRIGYDPGLIDSLLDDHARLGTVFGRIEKASKAGDFDETRKLLVHFKSSLQAHILTENVRFYTYIEELAADDRENARIMHEFRRDMNTIARQVVDFVRKYQACDFASRAERDQFDKDRAAVGTLLEQRLDSEENDLYPLYLPA